MGIDTIIIGAGASGLMCGIEAGKRGRSVWILEHRDRIGAKIRISGGGRCNFTNRAISRDHYLSGNLHFCRSALSRFTVDDFTAMLDRHRIRYEETGEGRLFCTGAAADIVRMLQTECDRAGVKVVANCRIMSVKKDRYFTVETSRGTFRASSLVMATGGLSYPNLGATDFGYRIARQFGLSMTDLKPALVPFTFSARHLDFCKKLSGISLDAAVTCNRKMFRGDILFTHRGLSGPAILQTSLYWNFGDIITVDLLPERDAYELLTAQQKNRREFSTVLSEYVPKRFAQAWCDAFSPSRPMNQYTDKDLKLIARKLSHWELKPAGTEGYKTAEVTCGGIHTDELSSKTMEAKKVPGLYFIGEVVDVTGRLGGYNLHWAWASGFVAGQYV
ncbi:MAG: NAD(P)/FAD-dependent oxidoreductase [bacterium]